MHAILTYTTEDGNPEQIYLCGANDRQVAFLRLAIEKLTGKPCVASSTHLTEDVAGGESKWFGTKGRTEAAGAWVRRQVGVDREEAAKQACKLFDLEPWHLGLKE